jgi:hypothetical protein
MKACKIDIKKTWVEIGHQTIYKEVIYDQIKADFIETGDVPKMATRREITYYPIRVKQPGSFLLQTYLVKENERKLFTDLMTIQNDVINKVVDDEVRELWFREHYFIEAEERKKIKELSWYKRLFNKF